MRIISGQAGSIPLKVPKSLTRPTTDRVREAVFSSLAPRLAGARVLDLFAGCGSLGLEALSRGAATVTFVDSGREAVRVIEENRKKAGLHGETILQRDVLRFLDSVSRDHFDLVFADPPYARDEASRELLESLLRHPNLPNALTARGMFILESLAGTALPESPLWEESREKCYGSTRVSYLLPRSCPPS